MPTMRDLRGGAVAVITGGAPAGSGAPWVALRPRRHEGSAGRRPRRTTRRGNPGVTDDGIERSAWSPTSPTTPRSNRSPSTLSIISAPCMSCATTPAPARCPRATCGNTILRTGAGGGSTSTSSGGSSTASSVRADPARPGQRSRRQHLFGGERRFRADRPRRHGRPGHRGVPDDQGCRAVPDRKPLHAPGNDRDRRPGMCSSRAAS